MTNTRIAETIAQAVNDGGSIYIRIGTRGVLAESAHIDDDGDVIIKLNSEALDARLYTLSMRGAITAQPTNCDIPNKMTP
jgi:RNA binding exosome subunit